MPVSNAEIEKLVRSEYEQGFVTEIESETFPPGLSEDVVGAISNRKREPEWMIEWRLEAYRHWLTMQEPNWASVRHPAIDYQAISYFSAPKSTEGPRSLDEVDPELLRTYEKLGIPIEEQKALAGVAVDAVFDSVSVATTFRDKLAEAGVIFCSMSEAVREHPGLVQQYLGSVVPHTDNFFAALNAAVYSDGTFVYVPKGVRCPMELSTYFRINERNTGQFERTLIIADEGSYVSYLEGCTAPQRDENQLHAAVVELVALEDAQIKYSTVQNWYPGDAEGRGGIYNFVTKRGDCRGDRSKISWTQVETGSAITWKYPSCILRGNNTTGEFYSVAVTRGRQQADTGTKMIHIGRNSRSTIVSKGIAAGNGHQAYRGLVRIAQRAENARNHTQCDSLLIGDCCAAHTYLCLPKTQSVDGSRGQPQGEGDGSSGRRGESVRMVRLGTWSLGADIPGGNSSMQIVTDSRSRARRRTRAGNRSTAAREVGLRLRRRVGTRDEDRRCEGRQSPVRDQAIGLGVVPEIACLTQDAFAPRDNRKSRLGGAA